ncbi:hypothetical protein ASB83_15020 [Listeria monocytogenes]|nr:hypothetical protein [Listeria monocytogenes]
MKEAEYEIKTAPVEINLYCPYCDAEITHPYDELENRLGTEIYFGHHGTLECPQCHKKFELGSVMYD